MQNRFLHLPKFLRDRSISGFSLNSGALWTPHGLRLLLILGFLLSAASLAEPARAQSGAGSPHPHFAATPLANRADFDDGAAQWSAPTATDLRWGRLSPTSAFADGPGRIIHHEDPAELWLDPEAASWNWLASVGIAREDFVWVSAHQTPRILYVHFQQRVGDLSLNGSRLTLQWDREGRLLRAHALLFEDLPNSVDRSAAAGVLSRQQARARALAPFPAEMEIERWILEEVVARPLRDSEELTTFWRLQFSTSRPGGWFEVWIDAHTGEFLRQQNLLRHGTVAGRVAGEIEPVTVGDPFVERNFWGQQIRLDGNGIDLKTTTDDTGGFSFDIPDGPTYRLIQSLNGAVEIKNRLDDERTPADTVNVSSGANLPFLWNEENSRPSDRDAFYHGTIAYRAIRAIDPGATLDALDEGIPCRVDDNSDVCNAFWNGTSLNFYAAGGGCVAAARVADIVYHEYGHAVAQQIYEPFAIRRDMGEAWSDYFAATLANSPEIGKGLLGVPETFVREIETDRVWPEDQHVSPHIQGLILAGALWDLRERIGREAADPLFHFARYGLSENFDDYMLDLLLYDDDDGDLTNGTPHFDNIIGAFRPHGIGDYALTLAASPLPDIEEIELPISGEISVQSLLGLNPDSLALYYRIEGTSDFDRVLATPTSVRQRFRATIAPPPAGSTIEYYWSARDTSGNAAQLPATAPEQWWSFVAGPDTTPPSLEHAADPILTEDQNQIALTTTVDDNSGRLQSVWVELSVDNGPVARQDLVRTSADGIRPMRYETTVTLEAPASGQTLRYRLGAADASRTTNVSFLPTEEWFDVTIVPGSTLDFELGSGGLSALGDWEWGQPTSIPALPRGERVWGTVLDGAYRDDVISFLVWGPLDIQSYGAARLEIEHYYDFVPGSDGARVTVSRNGDTWTQILPGQGYPFDEITVFGAPGFSGTSPDWESTVFSLDEYLGDQIWIRFETATDPGASDLGWYLNGIRLANAQALIPPFHLRASSGESERVTLSWRAPRGIDLFSGRFLGYQIFRAEDDGPFAETPIHAEPLPGTQFVDRDVQNDQTYRYRVESLYTEGASPGVLITAIPAAPRFALDATEVRYEMQGISQSDTTLTVDNDGRGTLEFDVFLAEADWSLDDARIEVDMATITEEFRVVARDPADAFGNPDIDAISMRRTQDKQFGPMIEFLIEGHADWGNSREDFGGVLFLDTDRNLATRPAQSFGWNEQLNIGWESIVLFGALTEDLGSTAPALFFDASRLDDAVVLERAVFPETGPRLRFSVPIAQLGDPEFLQVSLVLADGQGKAPYDRVPENPDLPWLIREPRHGRARGGESEFLSFQFDAGDRGDGTYEARAFLRTNDPLQPLLDLPIVLTVDGVLPGSLSSLSLLSEETGIDIVFVLPRSSGPREAQVQRRGSDDRWTILTSELLLPDTEGRFFFLDEGVDPGFTYDYRFRVFFDEGTIVTYGPFEVTYRPAVPNELALRRDGPNPFREGTAVLLELPEGGLTLVQVFSAAGRRVRDLKRADLLAGVYKIEWDGRLKSGESAPAGVYFILADTPAGRRSLRILRVR